MKQVSRAKVIENVKKELQANGKPTVSEFEN